MKNSKLVIGAIIVIVLGIVGLLVFTRSSDKNNQQETSDVSQNEKSSVSGTFVKGEKIPELKLVDFNGNSYELTDFEGRAILIDFWAGWCPFCVEEMPELENAHLKYGDDLVVIGVHRTDTESIDTGSEFANERGVTYLLISDSDGLLYRASGGFGMPVAIFIDKDGVVTEIKSGPKTAEEIKLKVSDLISGN